MKIAIDFDGTCVTHEYPVVGKEIGAVKVLKELVEAGHVLNLFTMRSGRQLEEAVAWFKRNNIELNGINTDPGQTQWTKSPKCYAQLYIDDAALGIPLLTNKVVTSRPYVDWSKVYFLLKGKGII